jgi:hypothetical protein
MGARVHVRVHATTADGERRPVQAGAGLAIRHTLAMPIETRHIQINFEFDLEPVASVNLLGDRRGFFYDGEIPGGVGGIYLFQFFNLWPDEKLRPAAWYVGQSGDLRWRLERYERASRLVRGKGTTWRIADEIVRHLEAKVGAVCVFTATFATFSASRFEEDTSLNDPYRRAMVEGGLVAQLQEQIQHGSQERLNRTPSKRRKREKIVIHFDGVELAEIEEDDSTTEGLT